MMVSGFFTQLFQQFVALLSVICITPSTPAKFAPFTEIESPAAAVAEIIEAVDRPRQLPRVVQTQIDVGYTLGLATARAADEVTIAVLRVPHALAGGINRGGLAGLAGGAATGAAGLVRAAENGSTLLVRALSHAIRLELALLGAEMIRPPASLVSAELAAAELAEPRSFIERVVRVQVDGAVSIGRAVLAGVTGVGGALLDAPGLVLDAVATGGPRLLLPAVATAAARVVVAAEEGAVGLITAVADFARAELALIPGAVVTDPREIALAVRREIPRGPGGPVEFVVRIPIATAVAASELTVTVMRATTQLTGAAVQVVTDVAAAARDGDPATTVRAALEQAPETLRQGLGRAEEEVQVGVRRARDGFRYAMGASRPETQRTSVRASGGSGTTVNGVEATGTATPEPSGDSIEGGNSPTGDTEGTAADDVGITVDTGAGDLGDGDGGGDDDNDDNDDNADANATAGAAAE